MLYNLPINIINIIYMENKSKLKYYWLGLIYFNSDCCCSNAIEKFRVRQRSNLKHKIPLTHRRQILSPQRQIQFQTSGLIGTWVSSVPKKGMQGSGKGTLNGTNYKINFTGDINLVVQKVENNVGTGTITFQQFMLSRDCNYSRETGRRQTGAMSKILHGAGRYAD